MAPQATSDQNYGPSDNNSETKLPELDAETREKNLRLLRRGFVWMAVGISIMGFSFMLQFFLFQADDRSFIIPMYVLTSIGALVVMKGFADAFGF